MKEKGIPAALLREMEPQSEIKKKANRARKTTFCRNWFGYVTKGKMAQEL